MLLGVSQLLRQGLFMDMTAAGDVASGKDTLLQLLRHCFHLRLTTRLHCFLTCTNVPLPSLPSTRTNFPLMIFPPPTHPNSFYCAADVSSSSEEGDDDDSSSSGSSGDEGGSSEQQSSDEGGSAADDEGEESGEEGGGCCGARGGASGGPWVEGD